MDAELKAKWVAALRSGDYKQTSGRLRRIGRDKSESFCCLGVLCRVAGRDIVTGLTHLPWEWKDDIDLSDSEETVLIFKNDGDESRGLPKHSFSEIADYIEANIPAESSSDTGK